jgi:hypothetical protein
VAHTLEYVISFSPDAVNAELENIEASEGRRFPLIRTQLARILAQRISEATSTQRADELLAAGRKIFAGSPVFESLESVNGRGGAAPLQESRASSNEEIRIPTEETPGIRREEP